MKPKLEYIVVKAHQPENTHSWVAAKGDIVRFERRPTEFIGWLWCTNQNGESAWAPESWVALIEDSCRFERDYNARELTIHPGEIVIGELEESGWVWIRNSNEKTGWVPRDCLKNKNIY